MTAKTTLRSVPVLTLVTHLEKRKLNGKSQVAQLVTLGSNDVISAQFRLKHTCSKSVSEG